MRPELAQYTALGWRVLPLKGKIPVTKNGCKDATLNPSVYSGFWSDPTINVGIATGRSSGLVVLDVDPKAGGNESLKELVFAQGDLPETLVCDTGGGGTHYYFRAPSTVVPNTVGTYGKGLDTRGENGYVVAPPSGHASGGKYAWRNWGAGLATLPEFLCPAPQTTRPGHPEGFWEEFLSTQVKEGGRNQAITSVVGLLLRAGCTPSVAQALAQSWNEARCEPPLSELEVDRIVHSLEGLETARRHQRQR